MSKGKTFSGEFAGKACRCSGAWRCATLPDRRLVWRYQWNWQVLTHMLGNQSDCCVGIGWYNCEARIYRFDTSTESNIVNAAIVESDDSRMKRTLTAYRFSDEQQLDMKKEAESSWAADGYIVLSGSVAGGHSDARIESEPEQRAAKGSKSRLKVKQHIPKCCML
jgi:hypothetical protein